MTTVKKTTRNTQITVRSAITDKFGLANNSRKFCRPLNPPSAPASEILVNEIFTNSIAGQITTNKINATAGPIQGSADIREFFLRCLRAVATVIVNAISSPTNPINPAKFFLKEAGPRWSLTYQSPALFTATYKLVLLLSEPDLLSSSSFCNLLNCIKYLLWILVNTSSNLGGDSSYNLWPSSKISWVEDCVW